MWPWGHLAVGYLLYAVYTRYRYLARPTGLAVVALTIGTQLPDLIDKPLAYWWVLPEGRSLGHSLFAALPICGFVWYLAFDRGYRRVGPAFALGYLTHLLGDAFWDLLNGDFGMLSFLGWPLFSAPDYEASSFDHHVEEFVESVNAVQSGSPEAFLTEEGYFALQIALFGVMLLVWVGHRMPPLPAIVRVLRGDRPATADR